MKIKLIIALTCGMSMLALAACSNKEKEAGPTTNPPAERTQFWMSEIDAQDENSVREILNQIAREEKEGTLQNWQADSLRSRIMAQTFYDLDSAVIYSRRALAYDSVRLVPSRHINELIFLASNMLTLGYTSEAIKYCMEGAPLAESQGDETSGYAFATMMGTGLYWMRDKQRGLNYLEQSIAGLRHRTSMADRWQLAYAMGQTLDCLANDDTERAIAIGREREGVIEEIQSHRLLPQDSVRLDVMRGLTYARMAYMYARLGNTSEASNYEDKYYGTRFALSTRGRQAILDYYNATGMHEKLLERYEESKDYWEHKDTICERYNDVLGMLALSYAKRGDYVMANDMRQRQAKVMDSIRTRENELEGLRMATIYQVNEKEAKLERKEMQNRFYLTILFLALATMVLLAVMLYILGNKNREIHYKNRMLVKYINRMNEESEVAHAQGTQGVTASEPSPTPDVTTTEADNNPLMQKHLAQLERLMNEEHVYLDSDFSREKLQRMMGLSKNALTPVLREGLNGRLLTEYVSEKRIAHACSLLLKYPEKNVTEIAAESGFYTLRNFNRVFRERMGMTASEYRKASL